MGLAGSKPERVRQVIISRTPLGISFAGGGTDLPAFYLTGPGAVLDRQKEMKD